MHTIFFGAPQNDCATHIKKEGETKLPAAIPANEFSTYLCAYTHIDDFLCVDSSLRAFQFFHLSLCYASSPLLCEWRVDVMVRVVTFPFAERATFRLHFCIAFSMAATKHMRPHRFRNHYQLGDRPILISNNNLVPLRSVRLSLHTHTH